MNRGSEMVSGTISRVASMSERSELITSTETR